MRILRAIVGAQSLLMQSREAPFAECSAVGSQFIRDDHRRNETLTSKQFPQQPHCRGLVALGLDQDLDEPRLRCRRHATYTFGAQRLRPSFRRDANERKVWA